MKVLGRPRVSACGITMAERLCSKGESKDVGAHTFGYEVNSREGFLVETLLILSRKSLDVSLQILVLVRGEWKVGIKIGACFPDLLSKLSV